MKLFTINDWSIDPIVLYNQTLREVLIECTTLTDEDSANIALLPVGKSIEYSEFSITRTA